MTMESSANPAQPIVSKVMRPLGEAAGWMKLIAILAIIQGVLLGLTIVGLLVAWLPIWMGVVLKRAADNAESAVASGDENAAAEVNENLKTFFKVQGVIIAFFLVWGLIVLAVAIFGVLLNGS